MSEQALCKCCGLEGTAFEDGHCSFCSGRFERWALQVGPSPVPELALQIAAWLAQLPMPCAFEIRSSLQGISVFLDAQPGSVSGMMAGWAALTHQQSRWRRAGGEVLRGGGRVLQANAVLPELAIPQGDALLALGGLLRNLAGSTDCALRIWLTGQDVALQDRLRGLCNYAYGTEGGVGGDSPNPWGLRLRAMQLLQGAGIFAAGAFGGALGAGLLQPASGVVGILAATLVAGAGFTGTLEWLRYRSVPKGTLERCASQVLLQVAFTLHGTSSPLPLLTGSSRWSALSGPPWPAVRAYAVPIPVGDLATLLTPPQTGEGGSLFIPAARQDVPSPPPSPQLVSASLPIGLSPSTGEPVGIDPDGHGLVIGGSRTGKSSLVYALLEQLLHKGRDAPGIFLVDPHLSLADAFLQAVDGLPGDQREMAIRRLRVITPERPELVPLNLLAVEDFSWAGNAIVQIGRRIWEDYWGPRMQAALLGLFRLAHAWNREHPENRLGLLHTVFAAFNTQWRHNALALVEPVERMGGLALDALLGQLGESYGKWDQGWVTEVVSPVLSKVMALELSPWLFAALHQETFVDLQRWVEERAWIILRLPSGSMGREAARLTAGVVYNVFDAAFRKATLRQTIPYYMIIDEAQEIAAGMRLEAMLGEGAKFGARMFVLSQSLSMMRQLEEYEVVVQSLLANTSTQAFFSTDSQDGELIRAALSSQIRYGDMTLDLPSLHAWLRARIDGRWQPPTLVRVVPLPASAPEQVARVLAEVVAAHPEDYRDPTGWQEKAVAVLQEMVPPRLRGLLAQVLSESDGAQAERKITPPTPGDDRRLGF